MKEMIAKCTASHQALRIAFDEMKKKHPGLTLEQACKLLGIKSKSYLSEVLQGKKKISKAKQKLILKVFGIEGQTARYVELLMLMERENDAEKRQVLQETAAQVGKSLTIHELTVPEATETSGLEFDIFASFGLIDNKGSAEDFCRIFKAEPEAIRTALSNLEMWQVISKAADGLYRPRERMICANPIRAHQEYILKAAERTAKALEKWSIDELHIASTVISVSSKKYFEILPKIKALADELASSMEVEHGDMMVSFNLHLHPLATGELPNGFPPHAQRPTPENISC